MAFNYMSIEDQQIYNNLIKKLGNFYRDKGFLEVYGQGELSILSACEDPSTVATFTYSGNSWPMRQTNQMFLEEFLLKNPTLPGVFTNTTSYRQEANPIPGRHDLIFPMTEFELQGDLNSLFRFNEDFLINLGFDKKEFIYIKYKDLLQYLGLPENSEIKAEHEDLLWTKFKHQVVFLYEFPEYTSPFFNMKRNSNDTAVKLDVLVFGMETIGSAERENDPEVMKFRFNSISNGEYSKLLYSNFGKERVVNELENFVNLPMISRSGGGIGMTRLIRACKMLNK